MSEKLNIRWAMDSDGAAVQRMADDTGLRFENVSIDWSRLEPYWIVAESDDRVVAAMQVIPSFPIGRMECLLVSPRLGRAQRTRVVSAIARYAEAILSAAGCKIVGAYIAKDRDDDFFGAAVDRGWVPVQELRQLFKRTA